MEALKAITQRPRPREDSGSGTFFQGGYSFPSGHSTTAWSVATVIAKEYGNHRWVAIVAYGMASMVSVSRFTSRNHFLSDVLVGSAIGYGIGRYVCRTHHDPSIDGITTPVKKLTSSKLFPSITPQFGMGSRTYGLSMRWEF